MTMLKTKLDFLECPHTKDLDEEAVDDILLSPGEERIKLLNWIFSSFDPDLADFLNPSKHIGGMKEESQLQRLLTAASSMGLCAPDDFTLLKGEGPSQKQLAFCNKLLDLVSSADDSLNHVKDGELANYIEAFTGQEDDILEPSLWKLEVIPKDLQAEVKKLWLKVEQAGGERTYRTPNSSQLSEQSELLSKEIAQLSKEFEGLQKTGETQHPNTSVITMQQMLNTVVRELRQQVEGFTHCYESHVGTWCMKPPPHLSGMGASFKRVHPHLEQFSKLLENLSTKRQIFTKHGSKKDDDDVKKQLVAQVSSPEKFHKYMTVIEETLHRAESNFESRFQDLIKI